MALTITGTRWLEETMSYREYVDGLTIDIELEELQVPKQGQKSIEELASGIEHSTDTINKRLSLLLLPEEAQDSVDSKGRDTLNQSQAVEIINECRKRIDDPEEALEAIAELSEKYSGEVPRGDRGRTTQGF
jgi:predicted RND superfamily exporter protein